MNFINKKLLAIFLTSASVFTVAAQESATGYFNDYYQTRWQMNPAIGNRNNYVGFPGLGNINIGVNGNLNPTTLFTLTAAKQFYLPTPISPPQKYSAIWMISTASENR